MASSFSPSFSFPSFSFPSFSSSYHYFEMCVKHVLNLGGRGGGVPKKWRLVFSWERFRASSRKDQGTDHIVSPIPWGKKEKRAYWMKVVTYGVTGLSFRPPSHSAAWWHAPWWAVEAAFYSSSRCTPEEQRRDRQDLWWRSYKCQEGMERRVWRKQGGGSNKE